MTEYPEILQDLFDKLFDLMSEREIPEKTAEVVAMEATEMVRVNWGGAIIYFPKGRNDRRLKRDLEIYRRFDGTNRTQLCREYGIGTSRLYQIIQSIREELEEKRR